jgi:predicted dehydrogenase
MNQTVHSIDQMLWLMGDVDTVTTRWGTYTHDIETEDTAVALITFKNGALGTLVGTTTYHNDRPFVRYGGGVTQRIEINGASGSAALVDNKTAMWVVVDDPTVPAQVQPPAINVFQDVARWIQDDSYTSPTLVKGEESRRTVELVLAIYESARTGQTVSLPLDS